jgi:DNA-directed RNA polymerase subunit RPC12/RpoP
MPSVKKIKDVVPDIKENSNIPINKTEYYDATIYCTKCGKFTPIEDPKLQNIPGGLSFQGLFKPTDLATNKVGDYMGLSCKHCKTRLMLMLVKAVNPPTNEEVATPLEGESLVEDAQIVGEDGKAV